MEQAQIIRRFNSDQVVNVLAFDWESRGTGGGDLCVQPSRGRSMPVVDIDTMLVDAISGYRYCLRVL